MNRGQVTGLALFSGVLVMVFALGAADLFRSHPAPSQETLPEILRFPGAPRQASDAPVPAPVHDPHQEALEAGFAERTSTLAQECGMQSSVACGPGLCAALTEMPDMDSIFGWARLIGTHRRFVGSIFLRDRGVPVSLLPCGRALDDVNSGLGAVMVERPDGSEVWCAVDGDFGDQWVPEARSLCEAASEAFDLSASGFEDPEARVLKLIKGYGQK